MAKRKSLEIFVEEVSQKYKIADKVKINQAIIDVITVLGSPRSLAESLGQDPKLLPKSLSKAKEYAAGLSGILEGNEVIYQMLVLDKVAKGCHIEIAISHMSRMLDDLIDLSTTLKKLNLPESKRGQPSDAKILNAVKVLKSYWQNDFEKEYKVYFHLEDETNDDAPVSEAAHFFVDIFNFLSPEVGNVKIKNQMTKAGKKKK